MFKISAQRCETMRRQGKKRTRFSDRSAQWDTCQFARSFPVTKSVVVFAIAWILLLTGGIGLGAEYQADHTGVPGDGAYAAGAKAPPRPRQADREHLGEWLQHHKNMSFSDQERAMRSEPGFNRLAPVRQKRLLERLQELDAMPPARRERMLERIETWERLSPQQRQQVRVGIVQEHQLPFDRQIMIHKAIRNMSGFPQSQRGEVLNSAEFRHKYSEHERHVLATLMLAQPYTPHSHQ